MARLMWVFGYALDRGNGVVRIRFYGKILPIRCFVSRGGARWGMSDGAGDLKK